MKFTELKCSACGGTMKIDKQNPNYAVCEYCRSRFTVEWDMTPLNGTIPGDGDGIPHLTPLKEKIDYVPIEPVEHKGNGWGPYGWKRITAVVSAAIVLLAIYYGPKIYARYQMDHASSEVGNDIAGALGNEEEVQPAVEAHPLGGILEAFASQVFDRPAGQLTDVDLAKIKWLEIQTGADDRKFGYSFSDPWEDPEAALTWISFPKEEFYEVDLSCLPAFTGLKRLKTNTSIRAENLEGLSLQGISGYFDSLEAVAAVTGNPGELRQLTMRGDKLSLQGAEQFPKLEELNMNCDQIDDPKMLVNMKSLRTVSVDMYDSGMDFSIFGMMPWLEKLTISSEKVRDLNFVSGMEGLKEFHITYGTFLTLDPLKDLTGLEAFTVERCDELKDMSALSGLTGLKRLSIDLPYQCPIPDLSGLTAMEELYLSGFDNTGFLRNMTALKTLTLDGCKVDAPSDFEGLVNLTTLNCTSFAATARDYGFITRLPALEQLNLRGTATYQDISGIFNLPTLKHLDISGMQCEINFDRIQENTSLESLAIDKLKLYKNVDVRGGGGIYSVNWDDVSLVDNLSFLGRLKGLRSLSIRENELVDVSFAASLEALEEIDFSDNYVTDLAPLSALKMLKKVNCAENPISNYEVLKESVRIIRE